MDWVLLIILSPTILACVTIIFNLLREHVFNVHIATYRIFNRPNRMGETDVKLTYKQWLDFAAIKPEAFCVRDHCLYEIDSAQGGRKKYTKIHFNYLDYIRFVFAYNRMQRHKAKSAVNKKERDDMAAFLRRMQDNIYQYRKNVDIECNVAKEQLSNVAENMLKETEEYVSHNGKCLCYKGTYPSTPFIRNVGDLYMSKDGKKMYVVDEQLKIQTWAADKLLSYISKEGTDGEALFYLITSAVGEDEFKYTYRGEGLTKIIPDMEPGDIYYNSVLNKYMVMEETGNMTYLITEDFRKRFGGINSCQNV